MYVCVVYVCIHECMHAFLMYSTGREGIEIGGRFSGTRLMLFRGVIFTHIIANAVYLKCFPFNMPKATVTCPLQSNRLVDDKSGS